ncbi:hypothetical protein Aph01nite_44860 [Acrocarpospora phusangensis]|uniref:Uncharacterized protein n=1 Tax=Acrocarpospora phusangensis TaxID=1070424 RepID=A0A919ULH2_9ACTN|nr:hypothetical protein [Acrocarpospora phusangensis]GIH26176.1 hypothetical protein Aph01nite_44860 [Acrocarpospora phusangensis]
MPVDLALILAVVAAVLTSPRLRRLETLAPGWRDMPLDLALSLAVVAAVLTSPRLRRVETLAPVVA